MNIGKKIKSLGIMMEAPYLFGLKLRGYPWEMIKELTRKLITDSQIKTVIDVGANVGQFATAIMNVLPDANVYSFEPLLNCYKHLERICQQNKRLRVYNIAIGDQKGRIEFFENHFSRSSSILKMLDLHKQEFPGTGKESRIEVEIDTLDNIAGNIDLQQNILLKIDTQGYEDRVIKGGMETIKKVAVAVIELSFEPLYDDQLLFDDIYDLMKNLGFKYRGNISQIEGKVDGRILQADGLFTNERFHFES